MANIKPEQLDFLRWEFGVFFHFGIRTFYEGHADWDGKPMSPDAFDPKELDCDEWLRTARDAGARYAVLVCKHHDGLCLWPTKTTEHNITKTKFRDGKGDYVKEMADACRKYGLDVGFYVSPWDRNNAKYGTPDYLPVFQEQLREILTNYGPAFELFLDGALRILFHQAHAARKDILLHSGHEHPGEFQALGAVKRHQKDPVALIICIVQVGDQRHFL